MAGKHPGSSSGSSRGTCNLRTAIVSPRRRRGSQSALRPRSIANVCLPTEMVVAVAGIVLLTASSVLPFLSGTNFGLSSSGFANVPLLSWFSSCASLPFSSFCPALCRGFPAFVVGVAATGHHPAGPPAVEGIHLAGEGHHHHHSNPPLHRVPISSAGSKAAFPGSNPPSPYAYPSAHHNGAVGGEVRGEREEEIDVGHTVHAEDYEDYKKDFEEFDLNRDGLIDAFELRRSFQNDRVEAEEIYQFFLDVDLDDSGSVSEPEYLQYAVHFNS